MSSLENLKQGVSDVAVILKEDESQFAQDLELMEKVEVSGFTFLGRKGEGDKLAPAVVEAQRCLGG